MPPPCMVQVNTAPSSGKSRRCRHAGRKDSTLCGSQRPHSPAGQKDATLRVTKMPLSVGHNGSSVWQLTMTPLPGKSQRHRRAGQTKPLRKSHRFKSVAGHNESTLRVTKTPLSLWLTKTPLPMGRPKNILWQATKTPPCGSLRRRPMGHTDSTHWLTCVMLCF
jgi:hypothetical protein